MVEIVEPAAQVPKFEYTFRHVDPNLARRLRWFTEIELDRRAVNKLIDELEKGIGEVKWKTYGALLFLLPKRYQWLAHMCEQTLIHIRTVAQRIDSSPVGGEIQFNLEQLQNQINGIRRSVHNCSHAHYTMLTRLEGLLSPLFLTIIEGTEACANGLYRIKLVAMRADIKRARYELYSNVDAYNAAASFEHKLRTHRRLTFDPANLPDQYVSEIELAYEIDTIVIDLHLWRNGIMDKIGKIKRQLFLYKNDEWVRPHLEAIDDVVRRMRTEFMDLTRAMYKVNTYDVDYFRVVEVLEIVHQINLRLTQYYYNVVTIDRDIQESLAGGEDVFKEVTRRRQRRAPGEMPIQPQQFAPRAPMQPSRERLWSRKSISRKKAMSEPWEEPYPPPPPGEFGSYQRQRWMW